MSGTPQTRGLAGALERPAVQLALIVGAGLLAYSNTLRGAFVFDDLPSIVDNRVVKSLASFADVLAIYRFNPRRFTGYLSFAVNYRLGGLNPLGYHAVNLAVHLACAALLHRLCLLLGELPRLKGSVLERQAPVFALLAAGLFVAHPVQTQAVSYVVQRVTALATLFSLAAVFSYAKARLAQGRGSRGREVLAWGLASLGCVVLAMRSKEIAFTLPLLIAAFELAFFDGKAWRRAAYLLPFLCAMALIPAELLGLSKSLGELVGEVSHAARETQTISRADYLYTELRVITTYVRLLFVPAGQTLDYDFPLSRSFWSAPVVGAFLFVAALAAAGAFFLFQRVRPAARVAGFGICWFFIALSVESSLIPILDVILEHRLYLPSSGAFLALAVAGAAGGERLFGGEAPRRSLVAGLLVLVVLSVLSFRRNLVWNNGVSVWSDAAQKAPGKFRPLVNLGSSLSEVGRFDEAIAVLLRAIEREPATGRARYNLGVALMGAGRPAEAMAALQKAIELEPDYPRAHYNLGLSYGMQGALDEAIACFRRAIALDAFHAKAHDGLGIALMRKGLLDEAIAEFGAAAAIDPGLVEAYLNLGDAYAAKGELELAIGEYQRAIAARPGYAMAHNNLAVAYGRARRFEDSVAEMDKAVQSAPGNRTFEANREKALRRLQGKAPRP